MLNEFKLILRQSLHTLAAVELEVGKASLNGSSEAKGSDVKPSPLNGSPERTRCFQTYVTLNSDLLHCYYLPFL